MYLPRSIDEKVMLAITIPLVKRGAELPAPVLSKYPPYIAPSIAPNHRP